MEWKAYWDGVEHPQILGDHGKAEATDFVGRLATALPIRAHWRVLDFGCGSGHVAELLAPMVREVWLWDAAPRMLEHARRRVERLGNVVTVDSVDTLVKDRAGRFDLILVNSVIQYMQPSELTDWVRRWRDLMHDHGRIAISDIAQPGGRLIVDLASLLSFCRRGGLPVTRVAGPILRSWLAYFRTRASRPLLTLSRGEVAALARQAGLVVDFCPGNLTHRRDRLTAFMSHDRGQAQPEPANPG
jgi:SAM-dependent methyltransferase